MRFHGDDDKTQLGSVIENDVKWPTKLSSELRIFNSDKEMVVSNTDFELISELESLDILLHPKKIH